MTEAEQLENNVKKLKNEMGDFEKQYEKERQKIMELVKDNGRLVAIYYAFAAFTFTFMVAMSAMCIYVMCTEPGTFLRLWCAIGVVYTVWSFRQAYARHKRFWADHERQTSALIGIIELWNQKRGNNESSLHFGERILSQMKEQDSDNT